MYTHIDTCMYTYIYMYIYIYIHGYMHTHTHAHKHTHTHTHVADKVYFHRNTNKKSSNLSLSVLS